MFTGIIEELGTIKEVKPLDGGKEFTIACSFANEVHVDESISINGACQTVTAHDSRTFTVQSVQETLSKTTFGSLKAGMQVNLERSLSLNKGIEGHLVQGHVDHTGEVASLKREGSEWLLTISYPESSRDLIVGRGSIAIDGISLTVAREEGNQFTVAIIPYTYEHTNIKHLKKGDEVNLEFDMLGKYVVRYLENRGAKGGGGLTGERLRELGY